MDLYFWKCAGIRGLKAFFESIVSLCTIGQAFFDINWRYVLSVSATAAVLAVSSCIAGLPEVEAAKVPQDFRNEVDRSDDVN